MPTLQERRVVWRLERLAQGLRAVIDKLGPGPMHPGSKASSPDH